MSLPKYGASSLGLLEPLKVWLEDPEISEILMNRPGEIYFEKKGEMIRAVVAEYHERLLENLFRLIANENHQRLDATQPLLSGSLQDGSRVQLVLPPTAKHHTFAIRRKVIKNMSLEDYEALRYYRKMQIGEIDKLSYELLPEADQELIPLFHAQAWDEFIKRAILLKKNIVISGGTSSGKTTFLNACLRKIPETERLLILEDTREIETPHPNQVNLLASKGEQGAAKVTMQDLVQCCLRLRPDRIIMGEIRGKEILDFVSACSTGHEGSLTTIHANNPKIAFMRMTQMYKLNNLPSMTDSDILRELREVIDIVIQVHKTPEGRQAHSIYYKYMEVRPEARLKKH